MNGTPVEIRLDKGYALLDRVWNPADRIVLELPVAPRLVRAHKAARELDGMAAIAAGRWYTASSRRTTRITPG